MHGAELGHAWPIAAAYALNRKRTWVNEFAASLLVGLGHLTSSLAVVGAYFLAISYFDLSVDQPPSVAGLQIGSPVSIVAGVLLVGLGLREYRHGHTNSPAEHENHTKHAELEHHRDQDHSDHHHIHGHGHGHEHTGEGWWMRAKGSLRFVGGHSHGPGPPGGDTDRQGLMGIVWTVFVLGFAHEEELEIIALCTGSPENCLALMLVYALAVIVALVGLTMALVAGYQHYEERVERYAELLPALSAVVLVGMSVGFVLGVL